MSAHLSLRRPTSASSMTATLSLPVSVALLSFKVLPSRKLLGLPHAFSHFAEYCIILFLSYSLVFHLHVNKSHERAGQYFPEFGEVFEVTSLKYRREVYKKFHFGGPLEHLDCFPYIPRKHYFKHFNK